MKKLTFVFVLCSLVFSLQTLAQEWGTVFPTEKEVVELDRAYSGKKIIVQNHYYPKVGKFDEVLALRIAASKLLKEFGLSAGRVLVNRQTMDKARGKQQEVASVTWVAEYESLEALKNELNSFTPDKASRFKKEILNKMKLLVERAKRTSNYIVFE